MNLAGPLWRNRPGQGPAWRPLLATAAMVWAAPAGLGAVLLGASWLFGDHLGAAGLTLWMLAAALTFSPLLSWIGWVVALPAAWWLLSRDRFGWVPAAAAGLAAGLVAGWIAGTDLAVPFGLASVVALRALLPSRRAGG